MTEEEKVLRPTEEQAAGVIRRYLPNLRSVRRTAEGVSTYVYRVEADCGVFYARFLPEDATFGVEILTHRLLLEMGVPVPEVFAYEPREPVTSRSLMILREIPGKGLTEKSPPEAVQPVLVQAGKALAKLHTLPVEGFGWIDRQSETALRGEHSSFSSYFTEFWEHDLSLLPGLGFSPEQRAEIKSLLEEALGLLSVPQAVLVHGDLSLEHIFQKDGRFTGFIDFGEIRGERPFFDLGAFLLSDETPDKAATSALIKGYDSVRPLSKLDLRAIELEAFSFALRFVGRKAGTAAEKFWVDRLVNQMSRL